jgi:hypothetical protein
MTSGLPVTLIEDGVAMAAAEHWRGAALSCDSALCRVVPAGVRGGHIVGGVPLPCPTGNAGQPPTGIEASAKSVAPSTVRHVHWPQAQQPLPPSSKYRQQLSAEVRPKPDLFSSTRSGPTFPLTQAVFHRTCGCDSRPARCERWRRVGAAVAAGQSWGWHRSPPSPKVSCRAPEPTTGLASHTHRTH